MKFNRRVMLSAVAALTMVVAPVAAHLGGGPGGSGRRRGAGGEGTIVSVDAASLSFVVQPRNPDADPVTVQATDETVFSKSDGTEAVFSDLAEGLRVGVKGTVDSTTGVLTAEQVLIFLEDTGSRPCSGGGTVISVDADAGTFTITGGKGAEDVIVVTTDDTVITTSDGTAATFDQIVVGAKVKVTGTVSDDGVVTAEEVVIHGTKVPKKSKKGRR